MCPKKAEAHPGNSVHGLHPSGFEFGVDIMGQIFQTGPEIEMSISINHPMIYRILTHTISYQRAKIETEGYRKSGTS